MWKRCIIMYLFGMLFSIMFFGVFIFMSPIFKGVRKESSLMSDTDYGSDIFEKNRTEMKMLEDYYNRIENWNFTCVYFWSEGKRNYRCYSGYFDREYTTDEDYVPKEFFEFSLKCEDFPEEGCRVVLLGNYWECPKYALNEITVDISSDSQILLVDIPQTTWQEAYYVYSPNSYPSVEDRANENIMIKSLENGWYYIFTDQWEMEVCY